MNFLRFPSQLDLKFLQLLVEPNIFLNYSLCVSGGLRLGRFLVVSSILVLGLVEGFIVDVTFLDFCATLHKPLDLLVNLLVFPEFLALLFPFVRDLIASEVVVPVVLNQLRVSPCLRHRPKQLLLLL